METLGPLPIYPSTQARKGFSASQLAQFHLNLSSALAQVIALPPAKRDTSSTRAFISSYANDSAQQALEALIWEDTNSVKHDDRLRQRLLLLAEKVASSAPGLEPRTLLDLCVAFPSKATRLKSILSAAALGGTPDLSATFASEVVPAFTSLLSPSRSSGLYGLRKMARCLTGLLRPSPPSLIRTFARSKEFVVALASAYDDGLAAISRSYGGMQMGVADRELDHWEKIWLDTKVDIVDAFHLVVTTVVQDISQASRAELAAEADRTFEIVFELFAMSSRSTTTAVEPADVVPFLNRSLVSDYQYAYGLNETLSALRRGLDDDTRVELLESKLRSLDDESPSGSVKDPGALKLILRSSGIAPGASSKAVPVARSADKGKEKATVPESASPPHDIDLDIQVTQVLDILPDHSPEYIRKLLTHPSFQFRGDAERVIAALLEGTAPEEDALVEKFPEGLSVKASATDAPIERRNVFDEDIMDLNRVHVGKKTHDETSLTRDRAEIERMKAEILRLAEAMSEDSDEDDIDIDDDLCKTGVNTVKVLGGGDDSNDESSGEHGADPIKPETILMLAYNRDPKLFDRDAETRRSKSRIDLKQQTGWADEQIEGWRIMLEKDPKKERILQKYEFSGNRTMNVPIARGTGDQPGSGKRGGGSRGGDRGRGGGRGQRGGRSEPGEKNDEVARERAFKEKHKNSNRRRGHDKKMTKANAGPST